MNHALQPMWGSQKHKHPYHHVPRSLSVLLFVHETDNLCSLEEGGSSPLQTAIDMHIKCEWKVS